MEKETKKKRFDRKINSRATRKIDPADFPPESPTFLFKLSSYLLVMGIIVPSMKIFMKLLNRTLLTGRENIRNLSPPWILASNHLTMLDDLFIDPLTVFTSVFNGYSQFPFHAPEETNFYKQPLLSWFMRHTKGIPLVRGGGIHQSGMNRMIEEVKKGGILHIYPEGTRSRTGRIGSGKPGLGRIVLETGVPVVPVFHQGLENVLPIGSKFPKIGNEIRISIGKPLRFNEVLEPGKESSSWRSISVKVIEAIKKQQDVSNEKWGYKEIITKSSS